MAEERTGGAGAGAPAPEPLLEVRDLATYFFLAAGVAKAVDGVSFTVAPGEALGLVGESGCGKSVTALSLLRLVPDPPGRIVGGEVLWHGREDLLALPEPAMRRIRGAGIAMIFQEPQSSLNPVFTVGYQIAEAALVHEVAADAAAARALAAEMLAAVGIPEPEARLDDYPHQLSGGMKQRVMIAMALVANPELLIADEPTTALDVTIQAQILDLLRRLRLERRMAVLLITHDLGIVAEFADRVAVMYASKIAEEAPVGELFASPLHPYTRGLFRSRPRLLGRAGGREGARLETIPGQVPEPLRFPPGCKFHPRCALAFDRCRVEEPPLLACRPEHTARCWHVFRELGLEAPEAAAVGGAHD
jgi:oligopeptide/dipeptide ABC transporter ATP-binding protein